MTVEPVTYSRYDVGYNFEEEMEARMVMSEEVQEFGFLETDVLALIVPDGKTGEKNHGISQKGVDCNTPHHDLSK